jgi:transcriptional regulator
MYIPRFNAVDDDTMTLGLLRQSGAGHLVSHVAGGFDSTLLPFLVDDDLTTVRGHLARANQQWHELDGERVLLIVPLTDGYVSPGWYPSKLDDPKVVPTWNYELVHVHATFVLHDDPAWVESLVRDLTVHREAVRLDRSDRSRQSDIGGEAWSVDDAPTDYIDRQLRAIVGVELRVDRVDAKRKLSQNRSDLDRAGVADGLAESSHPKDQAISRAMR